MNISAFLLLLVIFALLNWKFFARQFNVFGGTQTKPSITPQKIFRQTKTLDHSKKSYCDQTELSDREKGEKFVEWLIEKFNPKYFHLLDWRSDKIHKGIYPLSNLHPDLKYEFRLRNESTKFAVECKWRANYFNGGIEWAKQYQIGNYFEFSHNEKIPVFVVIGVGGHCYDPKNIYIIPLIDIKQNQTFLPYALLKRYKIINRDKFFYLNTISMRIS